MHAKLVSSRRFAVPVLIVLSATAIGLVDAFRAASQPLSFPHADGERVLALSLETLVDDGPVLKRGIRPETVAKARQALAPVRIAALRGTDSVLQNDRGEKTAIRLLDTTPALLAHLGIDVADACRESTLWPTPALATQMAMQVGGSATVAGVPGRVGGLLDARVMGVLPIASGAGVVRCSERPRDKADQLLVFAPSTMTTNELEDRIGAAPSQDSPYPMRWSVLDVETVGSREFLRRAGWLQGAQLILNMLAAGAVAILSLLQVVMRAGDDHVRRALGESLRHRLRRAVADAVRTAAITAISAGSLVALVVLVWTHLQSQVAVLRESAMQALATSFACAVLLATLSATTVFAARALQSQDAQGLRSTTSGSRKRSLGVACFAVAALCATAALPAGFLGHEFLRLSGAPQGYQVDGLYAVELRMLDHRSHSQDELWKLLNAVLADLAAQPGVERIAAIGSAPWSYAGEAGVSSGEEHIIINVTMTPGMLAVLKPDHFHGVDLSVTARYGSEVLVQSIGDSERRNFVPRGASVLGELEGIRFSPLDHDHRQAIIAPMRDNVPATVSLAFRSTRGWSAAQSVQQRLQGYRGNFMVGSVQRVSDLIDQRLQPMRLGTLTAVVAAGFSVLLLVVVLMTTLRLYFLSNRREIAIRLCVGASLPRLLRPLLIGAGLVFGVGWLLGSALGLAVWRYLVVVMQDYRLTQPWSGLWLLPVALTVVGLCVVIDLRGRSRQLNLRDALTE